MRRGIARLRDFLLTPRKFSMSDDVMTGIPTKRGHGKMRLVMNVITIDRTLHVPQESKRACKLHRTSAVGISAILVYVATRNDKSKRQRKSLEFSKTDVPSKNAISFGTAAQRLPYSGEAAEMPTAARSSTVAASGCDGGGVVAAWTAKSAGALAIGAGGRGCSNETEPRLVIGGGGVLMLGGSAGGGAERPFAEEVAIGEDEQKENESSVFCALESIGGRASEESSGAEVAAREIAVVGAREIPVVVDVIGEPRCDALYSTHIRPNESRCPHKVHSAYQSEKVFPASRLGTVLGVVFSNVIRRQESEALD